MSCCKFFCKIMRSPKNLMMIFMLLISISKPHLFLRMLISTDKARVLWLIIDPFVMKEIFNRSIERLLYEATYSILYVLYSIVFWVW